MSLKEMRDVDIRQVDRSSLADLRDIRVKKDSHNQPDIQDLLKQTANLYMYRVGEIVVALHLIIQITGKQWMIRLL